MRLNVRCTRPTSTRLEPVLALRGFDHWFLLSYTFPPCLPDPSRLVVPTRPVVVRAAPALPCVPRVRLPSASANRCDGPQEGSFHPLTVKQRLVAHSWGHDRNVNQSDIDWQFTTDDARIKLKRLYPATLP